MASIVSRVRGTAAILRALPGQRRVPFLPPDELRELRDAKIRETVLYAAEHVPHYRAFFRSEGLDPEEIRGAEDLGRLPFLEKRLLQEDPDRFRARSQVARDSIVFRTSGSTGTPLTVARDRRSLYAMVAYSERERTIEARFVGARYRYSVAEIISVGGNVTRVQDMLDETSWRPLRPRLHTISVAERPEDVAQVFERIRPRVVRSYGSYVELLFRARAAGRVSFPSPRVVYYGGDRMSPEGRRLIEDTFGIPVLSRYTAAEAIRIGYFCELRTGFHLHEDLCHLTVVDPDGIPVPPGEAGEIVVTDLTNRGAVLLNYRLGDLGRIAPEACACGRTGRVLTDLEGRLNEIVRLNDGTLVHPILIESPIRREGRGILRFQVVQEASDRFRIKVVVADDAVFERVARELPRVLDGVLHGASIEVERHEGLDPAGTGKFQTVVALAGG